MADALKEAQLLYNESLDALRDQRRQIEEDIEFSDPSDPRQWNEDVKRQRENDPGGKRPCLVHDQVSQYVSNVSGQVEQQPPSLHAIPVSDGADKKAAEQIDGRFRHIEYASRATQHYTRALTSAARVGVGYVVVRPHIVNAALNYQEPRISSEPDALKVVLDPWSTDTDGKDATFGFILSDINPSIFRKRFGKKAQKDFGDTEATKRNDERKSVLVAEHWYQETEKKNFVVYKDELGEEHAEQVEDSQWYEQVQASGMPYQYIRSYKDKATVVKWCMMSGADILEESVYPADGIGIIPIYGYVGFANGRMRYCGIPRRARAPQQAFNYHISEQLAYIATAPKSPWVAPIRSLKGVESLWEKASVETRGVLPYNDVDETGAPVSAPFRTNVATNLQNHMQGAEQALRDIQASIGMYQANLGAPSNETSGVAIESRKQQGEASTAHFPSHMAASLTQVGNIVMQMDAKLMDTRRKAPIIGVDMSAGQITIDPEQKEAFKRGQDGVSINPKVGTYSVRVVVGASYSTQRTQTNAAFAEIMRGNKELAPVVAPFWAQTLDFPGSDKFAQAMAAMAPAPVKTILQPEGADDEQDPAQMAQQLAQLQEALQEAIQHAKDAQQDADEAVAELSGIKADKTIDEYKAETDRLKVTGANEMQIQQITQELVQSMLQGPMQQMDQVLNPPMPEQPMEPEMPPEPAPEIIALTEGQQQLAQITQQIAQGQEQIAQVVMSLPELMTQLASLQKRTRRRIPVRDTEGNITEVIDKMDEESEGEYREQI